MGSALHINRDFEREVKKRVTAGLEKNVRNDPRHMGIRKSEREGLQEGSETSYVVRFEGDGTDKKTGEDRV